jgi:hypothetical protein
MRLSWLAEGKLLSIFGSLLHAASRINSGAAK